MLELLHEQITHLLAQTSASIGRRYYPGYLLVTSALRFTSKVAVASLICVLTLVLNTPATAFAQDAVIDKPRIGLALSGGGARTHRGSGWSVRAFGSIVAGQPKRTSNRYSFHF